MRLPGCDRRPERGRSHLPTCLGRRILPRPQRGIGGSCMKVIAIISQKGGAGKTTLAVSLSALAEQRGYQTVLFDLDPQASAGKWGARRDAAPPDIIDAHAPRLPAALVSAAKQDRIIAVIDTAPHADRAAEEAARVADIVLVPARPDLID